MPALGIRITSSRSRSPTPHVNGTSIVGWCTAIRRQAGVHGEGTDHSTGRKCPWWIAARTASSPWRGRRIGNLPLHSPSMIRYGELTEDEAFVTADAADASVVFENTGVETLVTLRYWSDA